MFSKRFQSLNDRNTSRQRCHARNTVHDRRRSNASLIGSRSLTTWRVKNQRDRFVRHVIEQIGASLLQFFHGLNNQTVLAEHTCGTTGTHDFKTEFLQASDLRNDGMLVTPGQTDKYGS